MPAGLQILRIESRSSDGLKNFDELRNLTQLCSLSVSLTSAKFDCDLLKQAIHLESLDLSGAALKNTEALAGLTELRVLNLSWCRGLGDVSFASSMPKLEVLKIKKTLVADLSPLEGLHALRSVDAAVTPVRKLPERVPRLRRLDVISSPLSDDDVRAFRRANPLCEVRHRWMESLQTALASATRLRVHSGGTCHRNVAKERTLFETNDAAEIRQLMAGIQLIEERSGFHCMCCGDPSLEFYDQDGLIVTLGFHHGLGLRWPEGWPGDAALAPQSADFLIHWLADRNVTGPLKERQAEEERQRAAERKIVQATTGMPERLAEAFRSGPEKFQAALVREHPDQVAQVEVWLRVFGTSNASWSVLETVEQWADAALREYDQQTLAAAVQKALTGSNRQLRRGAARLWMSWRSPLSEWTPPEIARLHSSVLTVQQEARYYPLRISALDSLAEWKQELSEEEFDRRLAAGLHDPAAPVRRKAMLTAGQTRHDPSVPVLMSVLEGGTIETWPLPQVPAAETRDVPEGSDDVAPGCSDAEVAALALAWGQHAAAKPLIAAIEPSTPLLEVSLALLGEGERLKQEHFAGGRNQQLQLAAVEAVVRSKGRHGRQLALHYQQATHWWEEEYVAEKLSRMLLAEDAPGSQGLVDCKQLETLSQWFAEHGAEYLKRLETRP